MQHLHTNPKYVELRQRGYTHAQIAEMIQHCQQQAHLPAGPSRPPPAHPPAASLFAPPQPQPLTSSHHTPAATTTQPTVP